MSLRPTEIQEVAAELEAGLAGAFVQKVYSPSARRAYVEVRQPGRSVMLLVCTEPDVARLTVVAARLPSPPQASPFQRQLRNELIGAKLLTVRVSAAREVALRFEREGAVWTLLAELGGRGDLVLMDAEGRVIAAGERRFALPRAPHERADETVAKLPSRLAVGTAASVEAGAVFPLTFAAEALYREREQTLRGEAIRRQQVNPLRTRLTRMERTVKKVQAEADRGPVAEEHQRVGALITQNLFRLKRGDREVTLTEYRESGPAAVTVKLDPSRSPGDEAAWHFHQYRRLTRGVAQSQRRLAELLAELEQTRAELAAARALAPEALEELAAAAPSSSVVPVAPKKQAASHQPFNEYWTRRGERIFVGKGGADNDILTFKVARPQDLWLHARGVTGAHVVVPLDRGAVVSTDLLVDAATLALHHAKTRGEVGGEVSYTYAKFVRRPKGGAPGAVLYTREKTFWVRLEPARLEALLKSREA